MLLFLPFRELFGGGTVRWNQRLTLVIETPQAEVRGSVATRAETVTSMGAMVLAEARETRSYWTGKAVAVEVLPGKWLFALLDGEGATDAGHWVYAAYDLNKAFGSDGYASYGEAMAQLRAQPMNEPVAPPANGLPLLVTFDDITRPESVREVDSEDLAAVFGEGMQLEAVTLEMTREAETVGQVEAVLGWLGLSPEPAPGPATVRTDNSRSNVWCLWATSLGGLRHRRIAAVRCSAPDGKSGLSPSTRSSLRPSWPSARNPVHRFQVCHPGPRHGFAEVPV